MLFKKENEIKRYEVRNSKVLCTIEIDGRWVSNPSLEQFKNEGWEEYTPPIPPAPEPYVPTYKELYKQRVIELIREHYSNDDELAILRQRDVKPEEFAEYNDFVESCKEQARAEYSLLTEEV